MSIEQVSTDCLHPNTPGKETTGIRIISQSNDIVQVEVCGQYFYISAEALGAFWTGQWVLFWWSAPLWARTLWNRLREGHWGVPIPLHLRQREEGRWILAGSSCGHQPEICEKKLKFNLIGRLLLMEHTWRFQSQARRRHSLIASVCGPTE